MGADFKEKSKKSFEKCWDNAALDANTPDLFSRTPDHVPNRFEAEALGNAQVEVGESVAVRMEGNQLIGTEVSEGGGIFWDSVNSVPRLELENVTFSGNSAEEGGAGHFQDGEVSLAFVTIGPNTAVAGDGIRNDSLEADIEMRASALDTGGEDCFGEDPVSLGGNVEREAADGGRRARGHGEGGVVRGAVGGDLSVPHRLVNSDRRPPSANLPSCDPGP